MATNHSNPSSSLGDAESKRFYARALSLLDGAGIPFLVGGAFALYRYTGIARYTKDFDVFVLPSDRDAVLDLLGSIEGVRTEVPFPHWLGKVYHADLYIDVIYSSGNGVAQVDAGWFDKAVSDHLFEVPVKLIPPEEMIWSKSLIMERERYDGADVAHIIRAVGERLDWRHLIARFGPSWRVLLSHLILFGFVYPGERARIPGYVMDELVARLETEIWTPPSDERICQGTLLSREQYLPDVERWGYHDPRLQPSGNMTREDMEKWTAAIEDK